jgi:hypothetical protein
MKKTQLVASSNSIEHPKRKPLSAHRYAVQHSSVAQIDITSLAS